MSKTIRNSFDSKLTYQKLLEAHYRANKGKRKKPEIIIYEMDLETNLIQLIQNIKNGTYRLGKYREFTIKDPKERVIRSLPYRDRIVHQWYVEEFIKPFFVKRFISDSYACINDRGVHMAINKLQKYMRKMKKLYGVYYVVKFDIKKFFYSIDRDILFEILSRRISDVKLLEFTRVLLIDEVEPVGIPIGNYTSQYFANIYLNELDHYIKEKLKVKYYIRYMDDFIMLVKDKNEAKRLLKCVGIFLNEKLKLKLNGKSRYYPSNKGIDFCGYVIFENYRLLRKRFKKKAKKRIELWKHLKSIGKLNDKKMLLSWNSMLGHSMHANSFRFMSKITKYKEELLNKELN